MNLRYASVFSGVSAESLAWQPLGWEPVWFAEIEPFPCAVLKHHHPNVPNRGDASEAAARPSTLNCARDGTANALLTPNGARGGIRCGAIHAGMQVRRLTVRECERLMGYPDGYTAITFRGKPAADGPRYRACGNSQCVNIVRWIGLRIEQVEELPNEAP